MQRAYRSTDVATATRLLQDLARRLDTGHPSAAASVREGLEETLTIVALGLSEALRRSFSTTNAVESLIRRTRHVKRNVNRDELGRLGLTQGEEQAIIAFMKTLTDGYQVEHLAEPHLPTAPHVTNSP